MKIHKLRTKKFYNICPGSIVVEQSTCNPEDQGLLFCYWQSEDGKNGCLGETL